MAKKSTGLKAQSFRKPLSKLQSKEPAGMARKLKQRFQTQAKKS